MREREGNRVRRTSRENWDYYYGKMGATAKRLAGLRAVIFHDVLFG